jgi:ribonuclease HI
MIECFTDGSCLGNPGPGGWAVLIRKQGEADVILAGAQRDTTNNQMELKAALAALEWLSCHAPEEPALLHTDSAYVQKGVTEWLFSWKKRGWRTAQGDVVKNLNFWRTIDSLNNHLQVTWKWVKAHNGHSENEQVDKLAKAQAQQLL